MTSSSVEPPGNEEILLPDPPNLREDYHSSRHDDHTQPYLSDEEVKQRQHAGALYTANLKAVESQSQVSKAVEELKQQGVKVTAKAVAYLTGMHRNTVRRYL